MRGRRQGKGERCGTCRKTSRQRVQLRARSGKTHLANNGFPSEFELGPRMDHAHECVVPAVAQLRDAFGHQRRVAGHLDHEVRAQRSRALDRRHALLGARGRHARGQRELWRGVARRHVLQTRKRSEREGARVEGGRGCGCGRRCCGGSGCSGSSSHGMRGQGEERSGAEGRGDGEAVSVAVDAKDLLKAELEAQPRDGIHAEETCTLHNRGERT